MLPGLLPGADRDLVLPLHKRLEKMFEAILLNTTVASLKEDGSGIRAKFEGAALQEKDREALLLIAWEDLTPALAAASLGISSTAFRVRLHRARRRLNELLTKQASVTPVSTHQANWRQT